MLEYVACPECGQVREVVTDDLTQDKINELALASCNCEAGKRYRQIEQKILEAQQYIVKLCEENDDETMRITTATGHFQP